MLRPMRPTGRTCQRRCLPTGRPAGSCGSGATGARPLSRWSGRASSRGWGGEFCAARRPTRGILLVLSNCKDPAREAAFNRWYEDIHVADILETGAFHTAYRYESLNPQATKTKYLALYETEQSDPAKAREAMRKARADWEKRGRLSDTIEVVASLTARRLWPLD